MVAAYRTHVRIIGDILTTTKDDALDEEGASVTQLIRKANLSHKRISKLLDVLVSQGLLEQTSSERTCKYKISEKGMEFLKAYHEFKEFADNFGLKI